jgi:hypothetical protein
MTVCCCYGPRIRVWEQSLCKSDTAAHINICKTQPAVNEEFVAVIGDIQRLKTKYILPVSLSVAQSNSRGRFVVRWKMIKGHVCLYQNVSKYSARIDLDVTRVPSTRSAKSGPHILKQKIRINSIKTVIAWFIIKAVLHHYKDQPPTQFRIFCFI